MVSLPGGNAGNISLTLLYKVTLIGSGGKSPTIGAIIFEVSIIVSNISVALFLTGP